MKWRRLAVAVAVLTVLTLLALAWAGRDSKGALGDITIAYGRADSDQLELGVASCNKDPRAEVEESTTEVRVRAVIASPMGDSEGDCMDSVRVTLRSPLNDRKILNSDGRPIPLAPAET